MAMLSPRFKECKSDETVIATIWLPISWLRGDAQRLVVTVAHNSGLLLDAVAVKLASTLARPPGRTLANVILMGKLMLPWLNGQDKPGYSTVPPQTPKAYNSNFLGWQMSCFLTF